MKYLKFALLLFVSISFSSCGNKRSAKDHSNHPDAKVQTKAFKKYWYAGKGEVSHYKLQQIRYGQVHQGTAIMVFVTENFLTGPQVKLESKANGRPNTTVMKMNFLRSFNTGIYRYNTMTSIFTPVKINEYPHSLKTAAYSQEWCGIWYAQLNLKGGHYNITGHSYFEDEADYHKKVDAIWLEDELWTKLRLNPKLLPEGKIKVIPGSFAVRRSQAKWQGENAVARKEKWSGEGMPGQNLMAYHLTYPGQDRKLTIVYEKQSPYRIAGWIETEKTRGGKKLTARSVRTSSVKQAYWKEHDKSDEHLRQQLDLKN